MRGIWLRPVKYSFVDIDFTWSIRLSNDNYFLTSIGDYEKDHKGFIKLASQSEEFKLYIIMNDKDMVGTISISSNIIGNVLVDEPYRGKGFGKAAINLAMKLIAAKGLSSAKLVVKYNNWNAMCFYKNLGFRIVHPREIEMEINL